MMMSLFPELEEAEYKKAEDEFQKLRDSLTRDNGYNEDEKAFQKAQDSWEKNGDLKSWNIMYIKIQKACFNCINKKLVGKVPNTTVEDYSHDITLNILNQIAKKRARHEFWKIAKLSAFVHLPCMAIFQKQKEFEDKILDESAYTFFGENGKEKIRETEESYFDENGIFHLRR